MTTLPQILRDSALPLPFVGMVALVIGDASLAAGTLLAGALAWLNLVLMGMLIPMVARATAAGESAGLPGLVLSGKLFASLAAFGLLMLSFPPLSVPLGLGGVMVGLSLHPMLQHVWPGPVAAMQES